MASAVWKGGLIVLALAQQTGLKIGTALMNGFCSPFPDSSSQAIWMSKVEPEVQGRVFATRFFLTQLATPLGAAIAGPYPRAAVLAVCFLYMFSLEPILTYNTKLKGSSCRPLARPSESTYW